MCTVVRFNNKIRIRNEHFWLPNFCSGLSNFFSYLLFFSHSKINLLSNKYMAAQKFTCITKHSVKLHSFDATRLTFHPYPSLKLYSRWDLVMWVFCQSLFRNSLIRNLWLESYQCQKWFKVFKGIFGPRLGTGGSKSKQN